MEMEWDCRNNRTAQGCETPTRNWEMQSKESMVGSESQDKLGVSYSGPERD